VVVSGSKTARPDRPVRTATSTAIVTRYGSMSRKYPSAGSWNAATPVPWRSSGRRRTTPNRTAPQAACRGWWRATMTSPTAMKPWPAVMPSTQPGVTARLRLAPASPARAPPATTQAYWRQGTRRPIARAASGASPVARTARPGRVRCRKTARTAASPNAPYTSRSWSNRPGPTTGSDDSSGTATGSSRGTPAPSSTRGAPRTADRPVPANTSASKVDLLPHVDFDMEFAERVRATRTGR
jgi:hypothetical protein